jgi:hypothetical protein
MQSIAAHRAERDRAIFDAWVAGARQVELAEQYDISQPAISQAIGRHLATLPPREVAAEVERSLAQILDLLAVYLPLALSGDTAASREVRGYQQLKRKFLGLDRREVKVEHGGTVEHGHHWEDGWELPPHLAEIVAEIQRRNQTVRAELTRTDHPNGGAP